MTEQTVVVVHQCSDESRGRWAVIVCLVDKMPKGFEDIAGGLLVFYAGRHLDMFSDNAASNGAGADIGRMSASGRTEFSAHQTVWTD